MQICLLEAVVPLKMADSVSRKGFYNDRIGRKFQKPLGGFLHIYRDMCWSCHFTLVRNLRLAVFMHTSDMDILWTSDLSDWINHDFL
jgi:hypothetical protein